MITKADTFINIYEPGLFPTLRPDTNPGPSISTWCYSRAGVEDASAGTESLAETPIDIAPIKTEASKISLNAHVHPWARFARGLDDPTESNPGELSSIRVATVTR